MEKCNNFYKKCIICIYFYYTLLLTIRLYTCLEDTKIHIWSQVLCLFLDSSIQVYDFVYMWYWGICCLRRSRPHSFCSVYANASPQRIKELNLHMLMNFRKIVKVCSRFNIFTMSVSWTALELHNKHVDLGWSSLNWACDGVKIRTACMG